MRPGFIIRYDQEITDQLADIVSVLISEGETDYEESAQIIGDYIEDTLHDEQSN